MKKTLYILACLILVTGCIQEKIEETTTTTTTITTTTSTTTTSTTTTTTTSTTMTTVPEKDALCHQYCIENGFLGGTCRKARFECDVRLEKKIDREKLCLDRVINACCCKTNESVEKNVTIRYSLNNDNLDP
ncbi:MAG: hypothetical protein JW778_07955 [Candidatus Altiarchaeota archaeon]|nr:hypothetical protein [Candidatus Altiarchaeota archaeon]